jgi:proteasome beta subunit
MTEKLKTGTTTVGITCKEGVVMATEHRATMGNFIAHTCTQKLYKIDENMALTVAGLVGDAQTLQRYLSAEVELYKLKHDMQMSIKAASTLMANILSGHRYYPYWVQLLIGGVDNQGNWVYSLDAAGGVIPDKFISTGSGSVFVYGVLEDYYKDTITLNDATDIAIRGVTAAMKRDSASGNGIELCQITKKGYKDIPDAEIKKRIKKLDIE